jgi:hypothetical protein
MCSFVGLVTSGMKPTDFAFDEETTLTSLVLPDFRSAPAARVSGAEEGLLQ